MKIPPNKFIRLAFYVCTMQKARPISGVWSKIFYKCHNEKGKVTRNKKGGKLSRLHFSTIVKFNRDKF